SAIYARWADRLRDPWGAFGLLIAAAGAVAVIQAAVLGEWLSRWQVKAATWVFGLTGSEPAAMAARFVVAAGCVVVLPTVLLGAAFPASLRLTGAASHAGRDAGRTLAWNTVGGIAGTLLTGFVLVPAVGLERSLSLLALAGAAVGSLAVVRGYAVRPTAKW